MLPHLPEKEPKKTPIKRHNNQRYFRDNYPLCGWRGAHAPMVTRFSLATLTTELAMSVAAGGWSQPNADKQS